MNLLWEPYLKYNLRCQNIFYLRLSNSSFSWWKVNEKIKIKNPGNQTPCHSALSGGIICGLGIGNHLRSGDLCDYFICSMLALSLLFFFVIERSVLMALFFYNKGMLERVTMQRTQQFSDFSISKEPIKCSECATARKIETDCFCKNVPIANDPVLRIYNDPVVRISRNLAKKIVHKPRKWSITKKLNFDIGNFQ